MPTKNSVRTLEVNRVVSTSMTIFKSFFGGKREVGGLKNQERQ